MELKLLNENPSDRLSSSAILDGVKHMNVKQLQQSTLLFNDLFLVTFEPR